MLRFELIKAEEDIYDNRKRRVEISSGDRKPKFINLSISNKARRDLIEKNETCMAILLNKADIGLLIANLEYIYNKMEE